MIGWRYEVVHDYNATKLIEAFREENLSLKNSRGIDDYENDFIVYAEKDDFTISLGRVLLIKMSDAMVEYYYKYKGAEYLPKFWAKFVFDQHRNSNTFHFTVNEIEKAFLEAVKRQTVLMTNINALDAANYLKRITDNISTFVHEDIKFSREQWDPTLQSDKYLFIKPELAVNYFINKCNGSIRELNDIKEKLKLIESFNVTGFEFKTPLIGDLIKVIDGKIKVIQKFKAWIIENKNDLKRKIPFICGVWNGLVEFVAGTVDIVLLATNILVAELLEERINLETLQIRESIEEILEALLKHPTQIIDDAINAIEQYKYTRYNDPKLNQYQLQYNEGEDSVLAIDIIVTVVTIIKGIAKFTKQLPEFTKWIDDVLKRKGKGALKVEEALQEAKRSKKIIGVIEYEILSENLLKKYIDDTLKICKEKGINLKIKWIDEMHPDFNSDLLGRLDVNLNKKNVLRLNLRPECPKITWFHEKKHLEDFFEIGHKKYKEIHLKTPWKHEQSVWNYIYRNKNKWSEPELVDAYEYLKKYFRDRFQKFPELKEMEDLGKELGLTKK